MGGEVSLAHKPLPSCSGFVLVLAKPAQRGCPCSGAALTGAFLISLWPVLLPHLPLDCGLFTLVQSRTLTETLTHSFPFLSSWPKANPGPSFLSFSLPVPYGPQPTLQTQSFLAELIMWKYWRTKEMSVALVTLWSSPVVYSMAKSVSAWRIQFFKSFLLFWDSFMVFSIHLTESEALLHMTSINPKYIFDSREACLQSE